MASDSAATYYTGSMRAQGRARQTVRASLDMLGLQWTEYRGLVTSTFVMRGTFAQWRQVEQWANDNGIPVTKP